MYKTKQKKVIKNIKKQIQQQQDETATDIDCQCQCQFLNDSFQNVNDSDCSCSQCLQANLNAFNQFKVEEYQQSKRQTRSLTKQYTQGKGNIRNFTNQKDNMKNLNKLNRNQNVDNYNNYKKTVNKINKPNYKNQQQNQDENDLNSQFYGHQHKFTHQNLNDYILITQQRTRKYLEQRKLLELKDKKQKQELKKKIKENLEILKYTSKVIRQSNQPQKQRQIKFKWNHQPVVTKRMKIVQHINAQIQKRDKQGRKRQPKQKKIQQLKTNLQKFNPQFGCKRDQIINNIKQQRLQKLKPKDGCPFDHCPNHHMRTGPQKIKKIQEFIKKQVQKYNKKQEKAKQKIIQKQKTKNAKLRAIDIKCKQLLAKSKKHQDRISQRTSFHLSIDHFSTFSELKINKQEIDNQKNFKKKQKNLSQKQNQKIQNSIYNDLQQQFEPEKFIENIKKQKYQNKTNKKQTSLNLGKLQKKPYNQKIVRQAGILSPKTLKQDDKLHKNIKKKKYTINQLQMQNQTKRKAQIQLEIQRKRKELMKEYKKQQQLKQSKNQKLKQMYISQI